MSNARQFQRIRSVFLGARDLDAAARIAYLDERCGNDHDVRDEVEALLRKHDGPGSSFDEAISDAMSDALSDGEASRAESDSSGRAVDVAIPERLGAYRIIRKLGAGGMGTVFEAEQDSPRRSVALKVLRSEFASPELLRRFRRESEILGRLRHPSIAQVYEAATFDEDRPYFAMELIDGEPLTRFADERDLGVRARMELLAEVADAIHHAHEQGIVHRDLKPSNILVDRAGRPRILDFGVARADSISGTVATSTGQLVGTLPYMSPEQVSGDPSRVDARSDVYALGVLAYELLARRLPLDVRQRPIPEAVVIVREQEPDSLATLNREFRGDLNTIVMKALEKEPERRYASAADFAVDVHRFLDDLAITARPPSTMYQLEKYVRRNRLLVGSVATIILVLAAATIGMSIALARALDAEAEERAQKIAADQARDEAEEEAAIAEAVNDFLNDDLLAGVDPGRAANPNITMREVLDIAAEKIEGRFEDQPRVGARLRGTLALTYQRLGEIAEAERHWLEARRILEESLGPTSTDALDISVSISTLYLDQGRVEEAEAILTDLVERYRSMPDPDEESFLRVMSNLGGLKLRSAKFEEATAILVENLEQKRRVFGDGDPSTLTTMNNLAGLYLEQNQLDRAVALYREVWEGRRAHLGEENLRTLSTASSLGWALVRAEQLDESVEVLERCENVIRARIGNDHPLLANVLASLGFAHQSARRWQESRDALQEAVRIRTEKFGPDNPETLLVRSNLALSLHGLDRIDDAVSLLEDVMRRERSFFPRNHWANGNSALVYGMCMEKLERFDEAEQSYLRAYRTLTTKFGPSRASVVTVVEHLADLCDATDRPEEAAEWRARLEE